VLCKTPRPAGCEIKRKKTFEEQKSCKKTKITFTAVNSPWPHLQGSFMPIPLVQSKNTTKYLQHNSIFVRKYNKKYSIN
jgi:hypothetical protein